MPSLHTKTSLEGYLTTSDNTLTTIINYTVDENSVILINVNIAGRRQSNNSHFVAQFTAAVKRESGTNSTSIIAAPMDMITPAKSIDLLLSLYDFNLNGDNFQIEVKGINGADIDWYATADMIID